MSAGGVAKAWGFYVAGVLTVLVGIYLYSRRLFTLTSDDLLGPRSQR